MKNCDGVQFCQISPDTRFISPQQETWLRAAHRGLGGMWIKGAQLRIRRLLG